MIEQVINWWNSLGDTQLAVAVGLFTMVAVVFGVCCAFIVPYLEDRKKTITQKWQEGLIGPEKNNRKRYGAYPGPH